MKFRIIIPIIIGIALATTGVGWYFVSTKTNTDNVIVVKDDGCLKDNEYADYPLNPVKNPILKRPEIPMTLNIRDKETHQIKSHFIIDNVLDSANVLELHKCNIYVLRHFDYDEIKQRAGTNYRAGIWRYDYQGNGEAMILLGESIDDVYVSSGFGTFFYVSPDEKYIGLERSYLGKDDYALVIKSLDSLQNIFTLPLSAIAKDNPYAFGSLEMRGWTKDGKYLWGATFDGAYVLSFFRIERNTWEVEVFEAPVNTLGGDVLNLENGWITHNPLAFWTGVSEFDEEIKEQYRKEGKVATFGLYNLFTKQEIILETLDDPRANIDFKWISDNTVEYQIAGGEKKTYTITIE